MDKNIEEYVKQLVSKLVCSKDDKNDIAEEMKDHLYLLKNEYLHKGLTDKEATQKALQDFGNENNIQSGLQNTIFPTYKVFRIVTWILFTIYSYTILSSLLFKRIYKQLILNHEMLPTFYIPTWGEEFSTLELWNLNSNWVPFGLISEYLIHSYRFNTDIIVRNLLGGVLMFIPLGIFLPLLFKNFRNLSNIVIASIFISFTLRFLRLVYQVGRFDVDKIILNTAGSIIGFLILKLLWKLSIGLNGSSYKKKLLKK